MAVDDPTGIRNAETPDEPRRVPHRWRHFGLISGTMVLDNTENSVLNTLFPAIRSALGLQLSALGILGAAAKIAGAVSGPLWVLLARRTNRKTVLFVCSGLWSLWGIAAGFAPNYVTLLVLYTVAAAGFAGAPPIITEIIADLFDDRTRGRAVGYLYGLSSLVSAVAGPLIGQLSGLENGWRYGFFVTGALNLLVGVLVALFFRDPGLGASDPKYGALSAPERDERARITWPRIRELFGIPTFRLMLVQRLLSGHLLIQAFAVVFLVDVHGFGNAQAAVILLPINLGYLLGTIVSGVVVDQVQRRHLRSGRVALLQLVQLAFAVFAFFGTQFGWGSFVIFAAFFAVLGFLQGCGPGINRPIVMAVVPPELRGVAFAVMLSVVEALVWAVYSLCAGFLSDTIGLQATFFWILVVVMLGNAAFVTLIYRTYPRDRDRLAAR